ncbi:MAG: tetratricopeptide repeat protein [Alphaproteobacteria bacterium]|nr:tetratricopeptide repeat protein [Alphaproteobacteria bacterium]
MSHAAKLLQEAVGHHQRGQLDAAEKAYRKLLRVEAVNSDGLRLLGGLYLQSGQWAKAVECLEKAVRVLPGDAETLANLGLALRGTGRVEEAIARYKQALAAQPGYKTALHNLGSLYHDAGRLPEALQVYGEALRLGPEDPAAHYSYANSLYMSGRVPEAIARYEHALQLRPDYLEAMVNLGMAQSRAGRGDKSKPWLHKAVEWFRKALEKDPANTVALNNLGNALRELGRAEEAVGSYREALRVRPDYIEAAVNLATSLRDLGRLDEAIESCEAALRARPESHDAHINLGTFMQEAMRHEAALAHFEAALVERPLSLDAKWNKALSLLALGQYEEGWALHEIGLGVAHMRGDYPSPEKRWRGESFAGKRLLLWCEQGLGDSLQFVRYAEMCKARGGTVILLCPRPLRQLLSHCPFIDAVPESVEETDYDLHAPLMSLPFVFGTRLENIPTATPYLFAGEEALAKWAPRFEGAKGFKVGLVWAGNPRENQINAHMIDRRRSMSLEMLLPLFDVPGVQFYSLQMGAGVAQIAACGLGERIIDIMDDVKNFDDTAAIVEQLDLVISVDTSVVHLAGGLGKPVWVLSRFDACWRWLGNRPDSPWYPSARVFGQPKPGDWAGVAADVRAALAVAVEEV